MNAMTTYLALNSLVSKARQASSRRTLWGDAASMASVTLAIILVSLGVFACTLSAQYQWDNAALVNLITQGLTVAAVAAVVALVSFAVDLGLRADEKSV